MVFQRPQARPCSTTPPSIILRGCMGQVAFVLDDDPDDAQLVAWTTTPWTLPSNLALCVNPDFDYAKVSRTH